MHRRGSDGALRHLDFTVLDMVAMQLSFILTHIVMGHEGSVYLNPVCRMQAIVAFSAQMAIGFFSDAYDHIFMRDNFSEFMKLLLNVVEIWLLGGVFLFLNGVPTSINEMFFTSMLYFNLAFLLRALNKERHRHRGLPVRKTVIVTTKALVRKTVRRIQVIATDAVYQPVGILLLDDMDAESLKDLDVPVFHTSDDNVLDEISRWWIDDVFLVLEEEAAYPKKLIEAFLVMGITVHTSLSVLDELPYSRTDVQALGDLKVITNSIQFVSDRSSLIKRMLDILGGLVGCFCTGLIFLFVAPIIYIKSPGPIFFKQKRVGQNGKLFYMYKFRSMYMDAEKRKAELMEKNKIQGGLMFKMDDDPRIIGSERKGKDGKPKGIGNFIRNTSLDEFPQFFNVLRGDMSLVGTRPPTVDEWNHYDPHHRVRMSAKPGITGMWQVSGRSEITDFEQVVNLDEYYIEHWSLWLDVKILVKTVMVVLKHDGAV